MSNSRLSVLAFEQNELITQDTRRKHHGRTLVSSGEREENPEKLHASCGPIQGNIYRHDTKIVDGYLGIPYAKPPTVPRLNCATITKAQCDSPTWRVIIAQDCPASCGFCNEGGCVDAVTNCSNDLSICTTVGMQDFVNTYCQRTCNRCPSTTAASGTVTSTGSSTGNCTSYIADTASQCSAWARNGFCTNNFYTSAQRRARCATTCRIC
ncbi:Protein CBG10351 [Caenorhabditis briggsae]|uniref:Protein CBG10351 n=1 Tax=Caenorhabditis briggsae TaxID=6238 RepID=A8XB06_CAEBR|nr:Protein CBG10351 [Caenorhabditis briggsae]CAP29786.1 Protein CBG10351 [Caenorhabditis briggsae]